jgi:dTDP-glucose 4,6-dehydratase
MKFNRALVTGGSGFIGSNFIRFILSNHPETEVVNLDKLTYAGNLKNLKDVEKNKNYTFIKGDICDLSATDKAMGGCDLVVNFAAETHVDRSIASGGEFVRTNVCGTNNLLELGRKHEISLFIQISTDEVYGSKESGSFCEEDALLPNSPYSASKAGADLLCRSYSTTYGMPVVITRSSNNFGPYQHPEKLIPRFVTNTIRNLPLPLYGDGLNVRDWVYVEDNCRAIDLVLSKGKTGQIYNIAAGSEKTNLEITRNILKKLDKPSSLIKMVQDRPGHDRRYSVDTSKLKSLGWKPIYSFEDAIGITVDWYLKNRKWWGPLV